MDKRGGAGNGRPTSKAERSNTGNSRTTSKAERSNTGNSRTPGKAERGNTGNSRTTGNKRSSGMSNSRGTGNRARTIAGHSLVADIGHISAVGVSHVVVDVLDPAVGQGHAVGAAGGVAVPLLLLPKVGAAVVVGHGVLVGVDGGLLNNRGVHCNRGVGNDGGGVAE